MRITHDPNSPERQQALIETQRRLLPIAESARKVLVEGQVFIIVIVPHVVCWVTQQGHQLLATRADDVALIADALSPKIGGPNSELVAEHVIRASTKAQLGISDRNSIELQASSTKPYRADLDCFIDDVKWHVILALLTPMSDFTKMGYEDAQLSSLRYLVGVLHNSDYCSKPPEPPRSKMPLGLPRGLTGHRRNHGENYTDDTRFDKEPITSYDILWPQNYSINDFIPSMVSREVDYFYSMLSLASGTPWHYEQEAGISQSIHEQEEQATDPDDLDPHLQMRTLEQSSLSPVLPRRPRDISEVQAEMERGKHLAKTMAISNRQPGIYKKNAGVRCLECGTDNSPEWRKGPDGPKTLCNRCGLRFAKKLRLQK